MNTARTDSLTMTIPEVARALGISRGLAYQLAREGKIPVLRLGGKRLVIPRRALERMLEQADNPRNKAGNSPS